MITNTYCLVKYQRKQTSGRQWKLSWFLIEWQSIESYLWVDSWVYPWENSINCPRFPLAARGQSWFRASFELKAQRLTVSQRTRGEGGQDSKEAGFSGGSSGDHRLLQHYLLPLFSFFTVLQPGRLKPFRLIPASVHNPYVCGFLYLGFFPLGLCMTSSFVSSRLNSYVPPRTFINWCHLSTLITFWAITPLFKIMYITFYMCLFFLKTCLLLITSVLPFVHLSDLCNILGQVIWHTVIIWMNKPTFCFSFPPCFEHNISIFNTLEKSGNMKKENYQKFINAVFR